MSVDLDGVGLGSVKDLEEYCRVCLVRCGPGGTGDGIELFKVFDLLCRVVRMSPMMRRGPGFVCPTCLRRLHRALEFLDTLHCTEIRLRRLLYPHRYIYEPPPEVPSKPCVKHDILPQRLLSYDIELDKELLGVSDSGPPSPLPLEDAFKTCGKISEIRAADEFRCDVCGSDWSNIRALRLHMRTHNQTKEEVAVPSKQTAGGARACEVCGRTFKYAGNLKAHRRLHTGERPFSCDMCDKTFSKKDNLVVHRKRHINKREFPCVTCGSHHYTAHELRMHQLTHTGDKPHACSVCGKRFTARNNLYIHYRTHTGEKPHECNECGKKFISTNILSIHKRTHTGEKPYVCSVCGKSFANNKLAAHMRTHTGEKRHVCTLCGRQFASPHVLSIHMRRHTGEKPYRCTICNQHYGHTQSLNKHMRRQHAAQAQNNKTESKGTENPENTYNVPATNSVSCITANPLLMIKNTDNPTEDVPVTQQIIGDVMIAY